MRLIHGTFLGTTTRDKVWPDGEKWVETTIHVLDGVHTNWVTAGKDFDAAALPALNEPVLLEVYSRGHTNKRVYDTAMRVVDAAEVGAVAPRVVRSA